MHLTDTSPAGVKKAVDQCAEVGFEMIIMSFGSGLNMESKDPAYIKEVSRHAVSRAPAQFLEAAQAYESYMFSFYLSIFELLRAKLLFLNRASNRVTGGSIGGVRALQEHLHRRLQPHVELTDCRGRW